VGEVLHVVGSPSFFFSVPAAPRWKPIGNGQNVSLLLAGACELPGQAWHVVRSWLKLAFQRDPLLRFTKKQKKGPGSI
jgi:hypothetical protein